jgi:hypothetical protein
MIITAIGLLLLAGEDNPSVLRLFAPAEDGFSVLLPDTPRKRSAPVSGGENGLTQWYLKRSNGAYLVACVRKLEMKNTDEETAARALKRGQDAVQSQLQAKLVREQAIKLQGKYPGREFLLEFSINSGPRLLRSRIFAANGVQYQIILVGDKGFIESTEANQVLDSFRIKN